MPTFKAKDLVKIAASLLERAGATPEESYLVAESLVEADLCGHETHGLMRLSQYTDWLKNGRIKAGMKPIVLKEGPTTAILDGRWGFGQVTAREAMRIALDKAQTYALGLVAAHNCNHVGRLGEYASLALSRDMIGLVLCNDYPGVAPYGSIDPLMGTNPISIAIPTGKAKPIVLDMATSIVSGGTVRLARLRGERIPLGWIIDKEGRPSSDPADLHGPMGVIGALLPFGGHKGSGLGIVIEILGGALAGSGCSLENKGSGLLAAAIKIDAFCPLDEFKARVDRFIETVKSSRKAKGFEEILMPGERAQRLREERLKKGITLEEAVWKGILAKASELQIDLSDSGMANKKT
ncbi:MAG: Ldh family oxidoreductase [Candidatus Bathyarchaeia archaeon]